MGIDRGCSQHFTGPVNRRHLATGAVAGVKAEDDLVADRRLQQQRPEVGGEDLDGLFSTLFGERGANFPFNGLGDKAPVRVLHRLPEMEREGGDSGSEG